MKVIVIKYQPKLCNVFAKQNKFVSDSSN